jgi:hypothetical protein
MQNGIGHTTYPFDSHLSGTGMKQGEQLGRAVALILVGLLGWLSLRLPTAAGIGDRLKGAGLIFIPYR